LPFENCSDDCTNEEDFDKYPNDAVFSEWLDMLHLEEWLDTTGFKEQSGIEGSEVWLDVVVFEEWAGTADFEELPLPDFGKLEVPSFAGLIFVLHTDNWSGTVMGDDT
jgi:hypothetical protein